MISSRSWKRIDWARAFSSDMWLTPKNWLSPKRTRSIAWPVEGVVAVFMASSADPRPEALARRLGHSGRGSRDLAEQHRDDAVGVERGSKRVLAVEATRLH